jgi:AraC-like DNA-binding protein
MKDSLNLPPGWSGWVRYCPVGESWAAGRFQTHRHDELEFNLVMQGQARYVLGDRRYDLERHSLVWLFPGQEHVLVDVSRDCRMWIAVFDRPLVKRLCRTKDLRTLLRRNPKEPFCHRIHAEAVRRLHGIMEEVASAAADRERTNAGLEFVFLSVWRAYVDAQQVLQGVSLHPAVERVVGLLQGTDPPARLDRLARAAGLSASRLSRLFKRQMGMPLTRFRNRQRLERFLRIYGDGSRYSLMGAALEAGFGSYAQFHRLFRQVMGFGPRNLRDGNSAGVQDKIPGSPRCGQRGLPLVARPVPRTGSGAFLSPRILSCTHSAVG